MKNYAWVWKLKILLGFVVNDLTAATESAIVLLLFVALTNDVIDGFFIVDCMNRIRITFLPAICSSSMQLGPLSEKRTSQDPSSSP